jgi:hypothetical protein
MCHGSHKLRKVKLCFSSKLPFPFIRLSPFSDPLGNQAALRGQKITGTESIDLFYEKYAYGYLSVLDLHYSCNIPYSNV